MRPDDTWRWADVPHAALTILRWILEGLIRSILKTLGFALGIFGITLVCSLWFPVTKGIVALILLVSGDPVDYNFFREWAAFWQ